MTDNTEGQQLTEGWDPTYTGPFPAQPPTNEVRCTDWVRQQVLKSRVKVDGCEGTGEPVLLGNKLAPSLLPQELATKEYVNRRIGEVEDSLVDLIAEEKALFYRYLRNQLLWFLVGLVIGMLFWWWYG